jgi:hypothetical protein
MVFCTGCGSQLDDAAKFCTGCGTPVAAVAIAVPVAPAAAAAPAPAPVAVAPAAPTAPAPAKSGGALKIILIILGIILFFILAAMGSCIYVGYKAKKALGDISMETGKDAAVNSLAELGIDPYPGATALEGSGMVTINGATIGGAEFETGDSVASVADFYRSKFPNSTLSTSEANKQELIIGREKALVTITIEGQENGQTKITIARMSGFKK